MNRWCLAGYVGVSFSVVRVLGVVLVGVSGNGGRFGPVGSRWSVTAAANSTGLWIQRGSATATANSTAAFPQTLKPAPPRTAPTPPQPTRSLPLTRPSRWLAHRGASDSRQATAVQLRWTLAGATAVRYGVIRNRRFLIGRRESPILVDACVARMRGSPSRRRAVLCGSSVAHLFRGVVRCRGAVRRRGSGAVDGPENEISPPRKPDTEPNQYSTSWSASSGSSTTSTPRLFTA